jgi:hypothetical protein
LELYKGQQVYIIKEDAYGIIHDFFDEETIMVFVIKTPSHLIHCKECELAPVK